MNLKTFGKKVGRGIKKNLPKILVCGSIAGMVTSVVFAVKATPKAMILLDEKKQELGTEKLDVKTIVKTAAPAYIPMLERAAHDRNFVSDNLYHDVFSVWY